MTVNIEVREIGRATDRRTGMPVEFECMLKQEPCTGTATRYFMFEDDAIFTCLPCLQVIGESAAPPRDEVKITSVARRDDGSYEEIDRPPMIQGHD